MRQYDLVIPVERYFQQMLETLYHKENGMLI